MASIINGSKASNKLIAGAAQQQPLGPHEAALAYISQLGKTAWAGVIQFCISVEQGLQRLNRQSYPMGQPAVPNNNTVTTSTTSEMMRSTASTGSSEGKTITPDVANIYNNRTGPTPPAAEQPSNPQGAQTGVPVGILNPSPKTEAVV